MQGRLIYILFPFHSPKIISLLFKRLVHPKVEVRISLASPYFQKDITVLEDFQRHATKVISGMQELSYPVRLSKLNYRRNRWDARWVVQRYSELRLFTGEIDGMPF